MKNLKKKLKVIMVIGVVVSLIAGCSGGGNSTWDIGNANKEGYPIVDKTITLDFFAPKHAMHSNYSEMVMFKEMEEITNIEINWTLASTENYAELRALAWNGDDLPDAFFLWNEIDEQIKYAEAGLLVPIEDLIDEYMPNYKKIMEKYPEIKALTTLPDGHIYSTAIINEVPRDQTFKQYINKTWLDNLGLKMPTNVQEYYEVLLAFKTQDPNGNGINDEIPLSSASLYQTRNFLMSAFGFVSTGLEEKDGEIIYVPQTDNYREYLKYANKLYSEGLLDNSTFLMSSTDLAGKGNQGVVGSFDGAAPYLVVGTAQDSDYVALAPITSDINSEKMWLGFDSIWPSGFIITKNNQNVGATLRWIDYLYSEEAVALQTYGKEGENWSWDDEAKQSWTFNVPDNMDPEQYRATITPAVGLGAIAYTNKEFILLESTPLVKRINEQVEAAGYMDYLKVPVPQMIFTSEENKQIDIIKTDLETYIQTCEVDFITGKKELNDENWEAHLKILEQMNIDKLLEIYNDAYARYLEQ